MPPHPWVKASPVETSPSLHLSLLLRQAKHGSDAKGRPKNAKGPTEDEFRAFIKDCKAAWRSKEEDEDAIFSWDNAGIHRSVREGDWEADGITTDNHTLLPPYSPDMHSVIELCHARLSSHMTDFINARVGAPGDNLLAYTNELQSVFSSKITPEWVRATTHRLFTKVLPEILKVQGMFASKQFR